MEDKFECEPSAYREQQRVHRNGFYEERSSIVLIQIGAIKGDENEATVLTNVQKIEDRDLTLFNMLDYNCAKENVELSLEPWLYYVGFLFPWYTVG